MNVAPAHQAPYRAEVIIRSAGAIVHAEVLMVIGIAGCESESGFTVACLSADSDTVEDLEDKARNHRGPGTSHAIAAWTNRVIEGEDRHGARPIAAEIDPMAWAERWGRIMLRHARNGREPSLGHRIGNAEAPRNGNELADPFGARRRVALAEQRVDRNEKLGPIMHREAPIGVREAGANGVERKGKALHVERRPPDRARATDVELETEHVA